VRASGGVGIGTASPSRQLEVQGAGDVEIGLKSADADSRLWTIQSSGNGTPGREGTFQIIDRTVGLSRLLINDAGLVGIGMASPQQPLHLNVLSGHGEGMRIDSADGGHNPAIYLNHTGAGGHNFRIASYGDNVGAGSFRIRDDTPGFAATAS